MPGVVCGRALAGSRYDAGALAGLIGKPDRPVCTLERGSGDILERQIPPNLYESASRMNAYEFGGLMGRAANLEKTAGVFDSVSRLFGGAAKAAPAVANTATRTLKTVAPKLTLETAQPSVISALANARGQALIHHPEAMQKAWEWGQRAVKRPTVPPMSRFRMPGAVRSLGARFGDLDTAAVAMAPATARFEQAMHSMGNPRFTSPRKVHHIISDYTSFGRKLPTTAKTWAELQGIVPGAMKRASHSAFSLLSLPSAR